LGELKRARELSNESTRLATDLNHCASLASALFFKTVLESRRGDVIATGAAVKALLAVTEEHNLKTYTDLGRMYANWVRGKQGDPGAGALEFKEALTSYLAQGNKSAAPSFHGLLAELRAMEPDLDGALATIDAGLAIAEKTGERYTDPYLYRLRGDLLLARSPAASGPAEEALQSAIAIANRQGARGYALLAALALAKLCQSTGRAVEARTVLAPALQGFSPTPEMPEIAEARALLRRLA
jgi:predicted ATPase